MTGLSLSVDLFSISSASDVVKCWFCTLGSRSLVLGRLADGSMPACRLARGSLDLDLPAYG